MLEVKDITKLYTEGKGISSFSLTCHPTEVIALIGPNGSGKTTTLKAIVGLIELQRGGVYLDGKNTFFSTAKQSIGYLPENIFYNKNMTGYELIRQYCAIKFQKDYKNQVDQMLYELGLWEERHNIIKNYSLGMQKKLGIIMAFVGNPALVVLDEPTNGVDTKGIINLKRYIMEAREKGSIIIISSHVLDFVHSISTKNIFLLNGKVEKVIEADDRIDLENVYRTLYMPHL